MKLSFKRISIEDKGIFESFFNKEDIEISEYSFTNLFIWRNSREIEYALHNEGLIIKARYNNDEYFLPPVGFKNLDEIFLQLVEYGKENNINSIRRLDEKRLKLLENKNLHIEEDVDNFDYLYNAYDLANLAGRKYSGKRNLLINFINDYAFDFLRYEDKYMSQCLKLSKQWLEKKDINDKTLFNEYIAINELIKNYSNLSSTGCILMVDQTVKAFAFGERLKDDTFVIHFEKADSEMKGIYQTINKLFVEKFISNKFEYVNREQDLGISGIRKAKESYYPVKMIKKYNITF